MGLAIHLSVGPALPKGRLDQEFQPLALKSHWSKYIIQSTRCVHLNSSIAMDNSCPVHKAI